VVCIHGGSGKQRILYPLALLTLKTASHTHKHRLWQHK
jgi:hypothetical protein